LDTTT